MPPPARLHLLLQIESHPRRHLLLAPPPQLGRRCAPVGLLLQLYRPIVPQALHVLLAAGPLLAFLALPLPHLAGHARQLSPLLLALGHPAGEGRVQKQVGCGKSNGRRGWYR
jgi:hypothetical protein